MRTLITPGGKQESTATDEIVRCFNEAHELGFWLDIEAPDEADFHLLEQTFKFHALTIEDIRHQDQRPKVDEYSEYNFTVLFVAQWEQEEIVRREHHLYVGSHYLITVHHEASSQLKALQDRIHKSPELAHGKAAFITYPASGDLVHADVPVLDRLD